MNEDNCRKESGRNGVVHLSEIEHITLLEKELHVYDTYDICGFLFLNILLSQNMERSVKRKFIFVYTPFSISSLLDRKFKKINHQKSYYENQKLLLCNFRI